MNRILVTGGAGFLGSNLCARLLQNPENQVTVLDNLFTGRKTPVSHRTDSSCPRSAPSGMTAIISGNIILFALPF